LENIRNRIIVIDHHIPTKGTLSRVRCKWIFTEAKACSLMVFTLLENLGMDIPSDLATLLLAGILYDTRRFLHANSRVFEVCSKLLKRGANYALALSSLVTTEVDISEKIAILKGLRRMDILRIGEFIVALSYVSAYEGVLARTLISLGVDLAIVVAEKNDTIRISARSSSKFYKLTGISLGKDLLPAIGRVIHGEGGGHATAGGAVGRGSLGQVLSRVYDIVIDILWKRLA
ncbi:MAG: phosphoesterase, partial [Thermoprotei archaeon]